MGLSRRLWIGALIISFLLVIAAGWALVLRHANAVVPGGPLAPLSQNVAGGSMGVSPGVPFTYGLLFLDNRGTLPAIIDRVELIAPTGDIELIRASVVPTSKRSDGSPAFERSYPPPGLQLTPAAGFAVEPSSPANLPTEVILGLSVRGNIGGFGGIAVEYHVGDDRFRAEFLGNRFNACAGPNPVKMDCPMPPA